MQNGTVPTGENWLVPDLQRRGVEVWEEEQLDCAEKARVRIIYDKPRHMTFSQLGFDPRMGVG